MKYKKVLIGLSLICVLVTSFCVTSIVHAEEENKDEKYVFLYSSHGSLSEPYVAFIYDKKNNTLEIDSKKEYFCPDTDKLALPDDVKNEMLKSFKNNEIPSRMYFLQTTYIDHTQSSTTSQYYTATMTCNITTEKECKEKDGKTIGNIGSQETKYKCDREGVSNIVKYSPTLSKLYAKKNGYASASTINYETTDTCDGMLTKDLLSFLQDVYGFIVAICFVILIIMEINDFVTAVSSFEDGAMKKAFQKLVKRIIAIVLILLLPGIIGMLLDVIGFDGNTCISGF